MRRNSLVRVVLAVLTLVAVTTTPASAANEKTDDFALSLPSEPVVARPGEPFEVTMRLVNKSDVTRSFTIKSVAIETQDEGKVAATDTPDAWISSIQVPHSVKVDKQNYLEIPVKGTVPANAKPDFHLIGVTAEPDKTGAPNEIEQLNQVLNHIVVEVPGNARRSAVIRNHKLPKLILGEELKSKFGVFNDGDAGIRFRGQVNINSRFGNENLAVIRTGDDSAAELLPAGRTKTADYKWKVNGSYAIVRPTTEVSYSGENGMRTIRSENSTVIILPVSTLVIAGILVGFVFLGMVFILLRRRFFTKGH